MTSIKSRRLAALAALVVLLSSAGCGSQANPDPAPSPSQQVVMVGVFRLKLVGSRPWTLESAPADKLGISHALTVPYGEDLTAELSDLVVEDEHTQKYLESIYPLSSAKEVGQEFIDAATKQDGDVQTITSLPSIAGPAPVLPVKKLTAPGDVVTVFSVDSKSATPTVLAIVARDPDGGRVRPYQVLTITVTVEEGTANALAKQLGLLRHLLQAVKTGV